MEFQLSKANRLGLNVLALAGTTVALYWGASFFIPLVIAMLLAGLLWPAVNWLNLRLRMPWSGAVLVVMSVVAAGLALLVTYASLEGSKWVRGLPLPNDEAAQVRTYEKVQNAAAKTLRPIGVEPEKVDLPEDPSQSRLFIHLRGLLQSEYILGALMSAGKAINSLVWQTVVILFVTLFLLLEGRMLTRRLAEIFGKADAQAESFEAMSKMASAVQSYLFWRTTINIGLAVMVGVVFYFMGLKFPWTWAVLLFVLNYIPYLGAIVAGLPPVLDAFANVSPGVAAAALAFYTLILVVEGYVVVPMVMGRGMELNATTVLLACMFWELVWGVPGLFLAMPIMAAVRAACEHLPGGKPWARLMATAHGEAIPADVENRLRDLGAKEETADDAALMGNRATAANLPAGDLQAGRRV
jgi:predicted PurR-regulated permease PerM